jgi:uncharacterized protein with HEPN domain
MKKRDDIYLSQIQQRVAQIKKYLKGISREKFLKSDLHKSAVVRELEVIGEAARLVSGVNKLRFPEIPWQQIIGMRNRLIHEYFSVDDSIVWEVAHSQLAKLEKDIEKVFLDTAPPSHPWRPCPLGYYFVHEFNRSVPISEKNPTGTTSVHEHCRRNPSGRDQLYPNEISLIFDVGKTKPLPKVGKMKSPKNANDFDQLIALWTQYWNDIFSPKDPLPPNVIKALFFSESSFYLKVKDQRVAARNYARGPLQITDETRKILADETGELKDHHVTLTATDVKQVELAMPAAVRWLFHKRDLASKYLGRQASWEEAVADYKGYLRKKKDFRLQTGMTKFNSTFKHLNEIGDGK